MANYPPDAPLPLFEFYGVKGKLHVNYPNTVQVAFNCKIANLSKLKAYFGSTNYLFDKVVRFRYPKHNMTIYGQILYFLAGKAVGGTYQDFLYYGSDLEKWNDITFDEILIEAAQTDPPGGWYWFTFDPTLPFCSVLVPKLSDLNKSTWTDLRTNIQLKKRSLIPLIIVTGVLGGLAGLGYLLSKRRK
jgi:hypothetical protein